MNITRISTSLKANRSGVSLASRGMAIYAMGDGWTGALGTGDLLRNVPGHEDEEEVGEDDAPLLVYDKNVTSLAAGWGHSAITTASPPGRAELLIAGRPHELSALLRLRRLPLFVRNYAVQQTLREAQGKGESLISSFAGKVVSLMTGAADEPEGPWDEARRNSVIAEWSPVTFSGGDVTHVEASAGLTAFLTKEGGLFTFGLNHHGQCGTGMASNNVWTPQPVMGLSSRFAEEGREKLTQEHAIVQVALGLQHGLALNDHGELFSWGKAERGQLGIGTVSDRSVAHAQLVKEFHVTKDGARQTIGSPKVKRIAAGLNHSAALTDDNLVFTWGKNVAVPPSSSNDWDKAVDALVPVELKGLPRDKTVIDISCGSHHAAVLLEDGSVWAVGISSDTTKPILDPIEIVPSGIIELPCRQFEAHFDRTTIVGKNGDQVLQVHLWEDEELQEHAVFTPTWMDSFQQGERIKSVHRGWLHTLIHIDD